MAPPSSPLLGNGRGCSHRAVDVRKAALSVFILSVVLLKVAEAAFQLERWPASSVELFDGYRGRDMVPFRSHLDVRRGEAVSTMQHRDFLLSEGEYTALLQPDAGVARRCGRLISAYNRTAAPTLRIDGALVVVEPVPRPGITTDAGSWTVRCPVDGATPGAGAAR